MSTDVTGEQLSALAYAVGPIEPKGLALGIEAVPIIFGIAAIIVVALRIYVRSGSSGALRKAWGVDDYLSVAGFIPFVPCCIYTVILAHYGLGTKDADLPENTDTFYKMRSVEYIFYWEINYILASTLTKCSIGFACLRLDKRKRIRIPIIVNMFAMCAVSIGGIIFVLVNCVPIAATWNPLLGFCHAESGNRVLSYIVASTQLVTDWICAAMPIIIVASLQMSRRKKASVSVILGMGVLASIATCIRMPYFKYYDTTLYPDNFLYNLGNVFLWSVIEAGLGIICCSLPPLRALFRYYYGSSHDQNYENESHGTKLNTLGSQSKYLASAQASKSGNWDRLDDDDNSRKGIIRETQINVTSSAWEK